MSTRVAVEVGLARRRRTAGWARRRAPVAAAMWPGWRGGQRGGGRACCAGGLAQRLRRSPCRGPRSPACRRWRCCWRSGAGAPSAALSAWPWKSSVSVSRFSMVALSRGAPTEDPVRRCDRILVSAPPNISANRAADSAAISRRCACRAASYSDDMHSWALAWHVPAAPARRWRRCVALPAGARRRRTTRAAAAGAPVRAASSLHAGQAHARRSAGRPARPAAAPGALRARSSPTCRRNARLWGRSRIGLRCLRGRRRAGTSTCRSP